MRFFTPFARMLATAGVALLIPAGALAAAPTFSAPQQLPHGDPKGKPYIQGGEPSIAFDPSGDGHVYVTAPQGIPAVAGSVLNGSDPQGVGYWASADHGANFPVNGLTGSLLGGGDSDVEVLGNHTVLTADLEAVAAAICTSTNFAKSFDDCSGGLAGNQAGPENDREWLTRGTKPGEVYLTYHDFAGGYPIIERSTNNGKTFSPCGLIIDPSGPAQSNYSPVGGTLVSKPNVGPDGTLYVEFSEPDLLSSPVGAAVNHLYMAVAKGGCTGNTVFKDYPVYSDPGASLANIFQAQGMDGGGDLYVLAAGQTKAGQKNTNLWLFQSADHGATWSAPRQVNPPQLAANVFPAVAGGPEKGNVVMSWLGTSTSGDPNGAKNQWRVYGATSTDGGATFTTATITPDVAHYGDICTQGIFCGLIPGQPSNRNLADFLSIAIDPATKCAAVAFPADPYNRPDLPAGKDTGSSSAFVSLQTGGCFGEKKPAAVTKKRHARKHRRHARKHRRHARHARHARHHA